MSHLFRLGDVFRLRSLRPASQKNINGRAGSRVMDSISSSDVNSHLGDTFADRFAVAEVSKCGTAQARLDSCLGFLVRQIGKPYTEIGRPDKRIHYCIQSDTRAQAAPATQSDEYSTELGCRM